MGGRITTTKKKIFSWSSLQSNPSWEEFCTMTLHCLFISSLSFSPADRKYPGEVDAWGEAFLSQCSHHLGGEQEGPEEWRTHTERAGQDEAGKETSWGYWNVAQALFRAWGDSSPKTFHEPLSELCMHIILPTYTINLQLTQMNSKVWILVWINAHCQLGEYGAGLEAHGTHCTVIYNLARPHYRTLGIYHTDNKFINSRRKLVTNYPHRCGAHWQKLKERRNTQLNPLTFVYYPFVTKCKLLWETNDSSSLHSRQFWLFSHTLMTAAYWFTVSPCGSNRVQLIKAICW